MNPASVRSWVRQTQGIGMPSPEHESHRATRMSESPHAGTSQGWKSPQSDEQAFDLATGVHGDSTHVDQPLDLSRKTVDGVPLDLTIVRPAAAASAVPSHHSAERIGSASRQEPAVAVASTNLVTTSPAVSTSSIYHSSEPPSLGLCCMQCSFVTTNTMELQRHFLHVHGDKASGLGTAKQANFTPFLRGESNERLHCQDCGFQCDLHQVEEFELHLSKHQRCAHQFACYHCGRSFHHLTLLREHILVHRALYHYICSLCSSAFSDQVALAAHMERKHSTLHKSQYQNVASHMANMRAQQHSSSFMASSSRSNATNLSSHITTENRCSPVSSRTAAASESSFTLIADAPPLKTFGQCLAEQIEAAISYHVSGGNAPTVSDLMFMNSRDNEGSEATAAVAADDGIMETSQPSQRNPLNLMSLLDKVVEESIRSGAEGSPREKTDLKFMVTFSDEEESKECDSTVANIQTEGSSAACKRKRQRTATRQRMETRPSSSAPSCENVVSSTRTRIRSESSACDSLLTDPVDTIE